MIRRFYVNNYRCLENFGLSIKDRSSVLLIGQNGSGKTTVGSALEILQRIARGTNRVGELVRPTDRARESPVRFEIEVGIGDHVYEFFLAFEFPEGFRELRVLEEKLTIDGIPLYTRERAEVQLHRVPGSARVEQGGQVIPSTVAKFGIDWHLVALPIVQERSESDPVSIFKRWLARMLILRPVPSLIMGDSGLEGTLQPNPPATDLAEWFAGLLAYHPSAYTTIETYLRAMMRDFKDIKNPSLGKDSRSLFVRFFSGDRSLELPFGDLSDGEKCFLIFAMALASNDTYGPLLCFWDEPDNYLAPWEIGSSLLALRKGFESGGQFIATSHNPEAIIRFSEANTLVLQRRSHLEPTIVRSLTELRESGDFSGDLIDALVRGDLGRDERQQA